MTSTHNLAVVADVLRSVVSPYATAHYVADDDDDVVGWDDVAAELYPGDATDAARDLLDLLAARGFSLTRAPGIEGNGLGARLSRLATASAQRGQCEIAAAIAALAEEADQRDATVVPVHLRQVRSGLPDSVASLCERRRA